MLLLKPIQIRNIKEKLNDYATKSEVEGFIEDLDDGLRKISKNPRALLDDDRQLLPKGDMEYRKLKRIRELLSNKKKDPLIKLLDSLSEDTQKRIRVPVAENSDLSVSEISSILKTLDRSVLNAMLNADFQKKEMSTFSYREYFFCKEVVYHFISHFSHLNTGMGGGDHTILERLVSIVLYGEKGSTSVKGVCKLVLGKRNYLR